MIGFRSFHRAEAGSSAVEFALLVPIMLLILGVMLDFGFNLVQRFNVTQGVSAGSNYTIFNGDRVSASGGAALASDIAALVPASMNVTITVNNGPALTRTGSSTSTSGTASRADQCYCPSGSGTTIGWGSAATCGSTCGSGGLAGKYVNITATQAYTPMFGVLGISRPGTITASALVQAQ